MLTLNETAVQVFANKDLTDGRYKKIAQDEKRADDFFIDVFAQAHEEEPKLIVIDLDATGDPLRGL
ncbi:MAG TPA: hypothetical protein VJ810_02880 [Blastocatellia bacterium]|nr:hypothetical protein [Blastocatellia bacterium]